MPQRSTLNDLYLSGVGQAIGIPSCNARFLALANRAQNELSRCGRWYGTVVKMRFCQYQNCITLPREVATIEKMHECRHSTYIRNQWWEFQDNYVVPSYATGPGGNIPGLGYGWINPEMLPRENVCTFQDMTQPGYIQLYPQSAADVGQSIRLEGINAGTMQRVSENVVLALPYAQSAYQYLPPGLSGVQKPVTTGQVNVTAYYPGTASYAAIGIWEASETYPWYLRFALVGGPRLCCQNAASSPAFACRDFGDGCAPSLVNCANGVAAEFLVRLEFIPVAVPTDWMFINNIEAVRDEMIALNAKDQNHYDIYQAQHGTALKSLQNELDKYRPPQQFTANVEPHGSSHPWRIFNGFI